MVKLAKLFKIKGDSLYPLYRDKDVVLTVLAKFSKIKESDVVVFESSSYGLMIKRVDSIKVVDDKRYFFLIGTSPCSIDSRDFGYIDSDNIKYKVVFKIFNSDK